MTSRPAVRRRRRSKSRRSGASPCPSANRSTSRRPRYRPIRPSALRSRPDRDGPTAVHRAPLEYGPAAGRAYRVALPLAALGSLWATRRARPVAAVAVRHPLQGLENAVEQVRLATRYDLVLGRGQGAGVAFPGFQNRSLALPIEARIRQHPLRRSIDRLRIVQGVSKGRLVCGEVSAHDGAKDRWIPICRDIPMITSLCIKAFPGDIKKRRLPPNRGQFGLLPGLPARRAQNL